MRSTATRSSATIHGLTVLSLFVVASALAADDAIEVRLGPDVGGIDKVFRRCFGQLREAGHDPERMPASEMGACMRPEIEAMAEFAYEVATAYPVSSLTRVALETCTLEQANALEAPKAKKKKARKNESPEDRLSWRWLTDCLKEVRWLEHDEQMMRRDRARRAAKASKKE
jgi:hypothetical protein